MGDYGGEEDDVKIIFTFLIIVAVLGLILQWT